MDHRRRHMVVCGPRATDPHPDFFWSYHDVVMWMVHTDVRFIPGIRLNDDCLTIIQDYLNGDSTWSESDDEWSEYEYEDCDDFYALTD